MIRSLLLTAIAALVAGCASSGSTITAQWPRLKGQPLQAAIDRFGYPQGEQSIAGAKVYTWSTSQSYTSLAPTVGTTYGTIGDRPVSTTTGGFAPVSSTLACTIRISVVDDKIRTLEYDGENLACAPYAEAMKR